MPSIRDQRRKKRHGRSNLSQIMCKLKKASMLSWKGVYVDQSGEDCEIATT